MKLQPKPQINKSIQVPYIDSIESIAWDNVPPTVSIDEAIAIVRQSEQTLYDINWQIRQRESNMSFNEIALYDEQEKLVLARLQHHDWLAKVCSVARSTGARKFVFSEALRLAGVKYESNQ
ncbi:hypothetical protein [Scytonema sp. NUACC26]|uniref:hypothetical protein n=1 Tax=Scytonema sp. NUACC26 TaxID=3140176 RepID=UPI0034DBEA34